MAYLPKSRPDRARQRAQYRAFANRQEIIKAGLSRRDLFKMGLLTGTGMLIAKDGLSIRAVSAAGSTTGACASPPTTPFTLTLPIPPVKQAVTSLTPTPTITPNTAAGEARTRPHQAPNVGLPFPPPVLYQVTEKAGTVLMSNQLPAQPIWGYDGITPGPTFVANYNTPTLVRQVNSLPANNGGFGLNSTSTHLHGGHTPSESDGFPCDFSDAGHFYDHYYPNKYAGFNSTNKPNGDVNEAQSTLWYHDHRVDFTAQNVYKGLAGFYLLFNEFDTGNETTGFHLPSFPAFDIPMMFADKCFDPTTSLLAFDLFALDGILGDKFTVNGVIQPVLHVRPRRYRFRWLNAGPSRFIQLYLTDLTNLTATNQIWQISNDGNLLPTPIQVPAVAMGVAERADVIVDFAALAGKTLYIENRLQQTDPNGPSGNLASAGQGNLLLKIVVDQPAVTDNSVDPATGPRFYTLPSTSATPKVKRSFKFDQTRNGQWIINDQLFDCDTVRFTMTQNAIERWEFQGGRGWSHPVHIHGEEFQILSGAPGLYGSSSTRNFSFSTSTVPTGVNLARKDVVRLIPSGDVVVFFRIRDFLGRYPLHCHNVIHEDHSMMLRFDVASVGDTNTRP
jgi:FtsP/CotA-like multicopper oxidase with cupredoxin domain